MSELSEVLLSTVETRRFGDLEGVIERGLGMFVDVGNALVEIRENRLYRTSHETFEDYCQERWGMDRRYANRHIQAAQVTSALGSIGPTPANEAQARELAPLRDDPAALKQAWRQAASDGKPTAEKVKAAVSEVLGANGSPASSVPMVPCPVCGRSMRADRPAKGVAA